MNVAAPIRYRLDFIGERPRLQGVRDRAEHLWRSPVVRAYVPGVVATTAVLTAMFAIRCFV
ncbi:MAG: hypothetical protein ABI658_19440 [Acidimicrobiales bacterium]